YFQSMMWLGRAEMQILQFREQAPILHRQALHATFLLLNLLDQSGAIERLTTMDTLLRAMVGEPDNMTPTDVPRLAEALGVSSLADLDALSDETLIDTLLEGDYGVQRIMSQLMMNDQVESPIMLPRTHLLLGQ